MPHPAYDLVLTLPDYYLFLFLIGLVGRVFANGLEDVGSYPGRVIPKTLKMVLDTSLIISNIRYISRVKWSNLRKGVAPSLTPRCCSYWKGSPLVTLDYGHQLYFTLFLSFHRRKRRRKRKKKLPNSSSGR